MRNLVCLFSLVLAFSVVVVSAQNEVVLQNDFEKGTQGWEPRGERVSIKSSKDQAAGGEKSLRISGRNAFWNGTQLNVTKIVSAGKTYEFTVSVKLNKGESPDALKMTVQGGDDKYYGVGAATANADGWTIISGKFTPTGNDPYLLVYIEAGRERTSFYIDDFKIEAGSGMPEQKGVLLKNDFEDSTAQNWLILGENVQMFSTTAGGSRSLKVSERSEKWHGLALDVSPLIFKGRTYQFSVDVKLVAGQTPDKLKLTMRETPKQGEQKYIAIAPATEVTDGEWVTLKGEYTATTTDNNLLIYVEADGKTTSFYLDNFELKIP